MSAREQGRRRAPQTGGMFEPSITFLKIKGIPIGAHWSWLFVFALIAWSLASQLFPRTYPGLSGTTYWVMALVAAVLFFLSVLAHELGHALTALGHSLHIDGITLWLFGGVARFRSAFPSPGVEAQIALLGPAVSLVLALVFGGATWLANTVGVTASVTGVLDYLTRINVIVLAFNLVPALPLDGGRALHAYLWKKQESRDAATRTAARAGQLFGVALIGIGVLGFFTGSDLGGLWIAFIGWFLLQAAQAEATFATMRSTFSGLRIRDLMTPQPDVVSLDTPVADLVERARQPGGHSAYPVLEDGRAVGLVSIRAAVEITEQERQLVPVSRVMRPADEIAMLRPDDEAAQGIEAMQEQGRALVVDEGEVVGIVSAADFARALRTMPESERGPRGAKSAGVLVWVVVGLAILIAASALYHPPVAVISPGPTVDVSDDIRISGTTVDEIEGEYLLTSVQLGRPSGLGALIALFHPDRDVVPMSSVIPSGTDPERYFQNQREAFRESREVAAVAAARAAGLSVSIRGEGARVVGVGEGTPAAGVLRRGDVIVGIDGAEIQVASDIGAEIRAHPPGTEFTLRVRRGEETRTVTLRSARLDRVAGGAPAIGVLVETENLDVDLPFEISFAEQDVAGPSAGFVYALAIADMLDPADLAAGRTIAATGTISLDGSVGAVGGVEQKAAGLGEDVAIFLVPEREVDEARGQGVRVRAVSSLEQALGILRRTSG